MGPKAAAPGIRTIVCNEDLWYLRLGAWLGLYRKELTHSAVETSIMAVPRDEVDYWALRLAKYHTGELEDGPARAMFMHDGVHSRQMFGKPFWLWGLRYVFSKRFRRRIEEEAYTVHLIYLAKCGVTLEGPYWREHLCQLYFGAFNERLASETFERIAAAVRENVPGASIVESVQTPGGAASYTPWLAEAATGAKG